MKALSKIAETRRNYLEKEIGSGLAQMRAGQLVASAGLKAIKDEFLYVSSHNSFKAYAEQVWGISEQHAHRMLNAAEIVESLPAKTNQLVSNEAQARALGPIPEKQRAKVLHAVAATGPVTAARITEEAKRNAEPAVELDSTGVEIPDVILTDWNSANEIAAQMLTSVRDVKATLTKSLGETRNLLFAELDNINIATAQGLIDNIKRIKPYAVCTSCQGHQRSKCTLCKKRGFISKFLYDTVVPVEQRDIRAKRLEKQKAKK